MTALSTTQAATVAAILDLARWAPSGDNTQPWRFEVLAADHVVVHGHDTREHCVYDLDGWASQISLGALLETLAIAARGHGLSLQPTRRQDTPDHKPTFDLHFSPAPHPMPGTLLDAITRRSVQRRPYAMTPLSVAQKSALEASVGAGYKLRWIEGTKGRTRMAALLFRSARLRLTTPEAYRVHRDVIAWHSRYSADRVPDQALGVPSPMLRMMQFAMHSWGRVQFFNRYLAGTWSPRLQMDLWPALACGAHFVLLAEQAPRGIDDHVAAGRAMQRFWLTATSLGLSLQPELTPLIFARYATQGRGFSVNEGTADAAQAVAAGLARTAGPDVASHGVFVGRIGLGPEVVARSLRLGVDELTITRQEAGQEEASAAATAASAPKRAATEVSP